jgi:hypothetical protein
MDFERPPEPAGVEGDEYGPVELGAGWHLLSLLCFAGALGARYLVAAMPITWSLGPRWTRVLLPGLATLIFAICGLLLGLVGMRRGDSRALSRLGVALNGLALVLALLLTAAFFWILP